MLRLAPESMNRRWLLLSAIGLLIFLLVQVFSVTGELFSSDSHATLTRADAERAAAKLAESRFGVPPASIGKTTVTHLSDSDANGYFSKNNLLDVYAKQADAALPTDVYAVDMQLADGGGHLVLSLQMETGRLVAWSHRVARAGSAAAAPDTAASDDAAFAKQALAYAAHWGIEPQDWEWTGTAREAGTVKFQSRLAPIGEARAMLEIKLPAQADFDPAASSVPVWSGGSVGYTYELPDSFLSYMKKQESLAGRLSGFGFYLPLVLFFVAAIVYAGTHGSFTSYSRGVFLSLLYFALYVGITFNMLPGLRSGVWQAAGGGLGDGASAAVIAVSLVIYAAMAGLAYFSAVAGDGLWKSMGYSLWPRWREAGYGQAVLRSMKEGYLLAFILLGAQSVILLALEKSLGSFSSSDATQSTYNLYLPWVLPILAWCAGIGEELQNRLFGIGLFRSWLVGGARKLLGREPSRGAAIALTTAAMLPPGVLWAMGHVGYAVYPVYTRVIELTIMSVLFGWFMLRSGLMTVIFAHVTLDAILMGVQMIFDGLPGDPVSGLFAFVMPGLVGYAIYWLHGRLRRTGRGVGGQMKPAG